MAEDRRGVNTLYPEASGTNVRLLSTDAANLLGEESDGEGEGDTLSPHAFYSSVAFAAAFAPAGVPASVPSGLSPGPKRPHRLDTSGLTVDVGRGTGAAPAHHTPAVPMSPMTRACALQAPEPQLKKIMSGAMRSLASMDLNEETHVAVDNLPITEELAAAAAHIDKCVQRRHKYRHDEVAALDAILSPQHRLPPRATAPYLPFEPSRFDPDAGPVPAPMPPKMAHELAFENGVYSVKLPDGRTLEAPVSCSEFYDDMRRTMKVVLNPPTVSACGCCCTLTFRWAVVWWR